MIKTMNPVCVAIVGATGAVGKILLGLLQERGFPVGELRLFCSARSAGTKLSFKGASVVCNQLTPGCFDGVDFAFFDASDAVSAEWAPQALESGAWVIDNSSVYRMDPDQPLVVPEVNGDDWLGLLSHNLALGKPKKVSGPNCVAVPLSVVLCPIQKKWGLKRVIVSTYQSTSGAGAQAVAELKTQSEAVLKGLTPESKVFPHQIAYNCIPQIGRFLEDGTTSEEQKIVSECGKILGQNDLKMVATAVRVPTFWGHAMSLSVECFDPIADVPAVRAELTGQMGLVLQDEVAAGIYPLSVTASSDPLVAATGSDQVHVGRVRLDPTVDSGLHLWVVSDNLRKGAALNAIQIGEILLKHLF